MTQLINEEVNLLIAAAHPFGLIVNTKNGFNLLKGILEKTDGFIVTDSKKEGIEVRVMTTIVGRDYLLENHNEEFGKSLVSQQQNEFIATLAGIEKERQVSSETFSLSKGIFIRNTVSNLALAFFNKESDLNSELLAKKVESISDIAEALWEEIEAREQIDKVKELL